MPVYRTVTAKTIAECKGLISQVAREMRVPERLILSRDRYGPTMAARYKAIRRVHGAFPKLSMGHLGQLFNRDRTTILYALELRERKPKF